MRAFVVFLAFVTLVAGAFALRNRSIDHLRRHYEATTLGEPRSAVLQRMSLRTSDGPPPERYRNDIRWAFEGRRDACRTWGVRHGGFLSANYSMIVGFDGDGRVAFKAIGNT